MRPTFIDTGPLVALLDAGDQDHGRCVEAAKRLPATLVTTWQVITEAMYLLLKGPEAQDQLLARIEDGSIYMAEMGQRDIAPIRGLMRKYRELPMDFADATLVWIAQRDGIQHVFTLDHRDFRLYRGKKGHPFTLVP